jgi:hypothetical protein
MTDAGRDFKREMPDPGVYRVSFDGGTMTATLMAAAIWALSQDGPVYGATLEFDDV